MSLSRVAAIAVAFGLAASPSAGTAAPVPKGAGAGTATPEVHVVGVYEGTYPPGVQHMAGFHPRGAVTVKVGDVKKPVILVLTSYEPVAWRVEAPKGAVVKVIASGYHKQEVIGLDKGVPVTLISQEAGDRDYFYAYRIAAGPTAPDGEREEAKKSYERLAGRVKELTRQEVKTFQGEYAGDTFEIR